MLSDIRIKFSFFFPLIIILFFGNSVLNGQENPEILEPGINCIYGMQFDSANIFFSDYIKKNPSDPAGYFFSSMIEWWKINVNKNDVTSDDIFLSKVNTTIKVCDDLLDVNERNFRALFFKGGALGYRGLVRSLRDSWLQAAEDGKQALNLLQEALEIKPESKDALLGIGIYNYFAEYVPEYYPFIRPLMIIFPKGDRIKGLMQIKEAVNGAVYAKTESMYILAYLNITYEKNYQEAEYYSRKLYDKYPENPVFEKYLYSSLVGLSRFPEALEGWLSILKKNRDNKTAYGNKFVQREALYYISLCLLKTERINEAESYLFECYELNKQIDSEATSYTAYTNLLLGMFYDIKGDRNKASYYYDAVLSMKNFSNSHAEAEKLKKNGYR